MCRNSKAFFKPAPAIMGAESRNEKRAAASRSKPRTSPAVMVAPDFESAQAHVIQRTPPAPKANRPGVCGCFDGCSWLGTMGQIRAWEEMVASLGRP